VWLADLGDFAAFNDEYRRHFELGFPARSTVQATLYGGARIEIEAQALVAQGAPREGGG
jgi:2-iminobutanoate/2-iminopropanoate deaminase